MSRLSSPRARFVALDGPLSHAISRLASAVGSAVHHLGSRADAIRFRERRRDRRTPNTESQRHEVGATPPFSRVDVDGVSLAYNDEGNGPVVVCLHAIGHGARDFEGTRERLKGDFRVIALDWPGHGRSSEDRVPHSMHRYAELLHGFLDRLGIRQCVLVGNSIGGGAAIIFAAEHPARVRGLILENSGGLAPIDVAARTVMKSLSRIFAAGARGVPWFPFAFAAYYRFVLPLPAAHAQRTRIVAAGIDSAAALSEAWASFARPEADLRELAPKISMPVLVLWAMAEKLNVLSRSVEAVKRFPTARLVELAGGHSPHLEVPDAFEALARDFLGALPSIHQ